METQTTEFVVYKEGNTVKKVGRSTILQPKTHFKGGKVKWYQDKQKKGR